MTKSEARAISDCLVIARMMLNGTKTLLDKSLAGGLVVEDVKLMEDKICEAYAEVERVYNMASSELEGRNK